MDINTCKRAFAAAMSVLTLAAYLPMTGCNSSKSGKSSEVKNVQSSELFSELLRKAVRVAAASTSGADIIITDASLPEDSMLTESRFSVRGKLSSPIRLKKVWGGVYNADGTPTDVYYEDEPDSLTYDLGTVFNEMLDTGKLPEGSYTYRIEASDVEDASAVLVEKGFSIVYDESAASDIHIYNASYPTGAYIEGRSVGLRGEVVSSHTITRVSGGIYKAEGSDSSYGDDFTFVSEGGRKSIDISQLCGEFAVGSLPAGEYVYRLTVTDKKGYEKELVNSPFSVISSDLDTYLTQPVMRGFDTRGHGDDIEWTKLSADGIGFAVICAGTDSGDPAYASGKELILDYDGARNAGLKVGFSFYTSAVNKSLMKAGIDSLVKKLDGKKSDMPIYINAEAKVGTALPAENMTDILVYGCEQLSANGYKAGIYSSCDWFRDNIDLKRLSSSGCDIWLAFSTEDQKCVSWLNSEETLEVIEIEPEPVPEPETEPEEGAEQEMDEDTEQEPVEESVVETIIEIDEEHLNALVSPESYGLTAVQPEEGTVHFNKERAAGGERVTVSVGTDRMHTVKSVKYNGAEASRNADGTYSFTMSFSDTEVTAEFEECDPADTALDKGEIIEMPIPFGTAGTSSEYYGTPCGEELAILPEALMRLTADGYSWEYTYAVGKPAWPVTLMDHPNIYSFIHTHGLDKNKVRSILSDGDKMIHRKPFTDEEIDLLLGDDEAKAMEHFASDSTIVVDGKGYSAKWMYYHTTDEYREAGITPEMVREKLTFYYDPLYVQEAADAFSQKLFSYTGIISETKCRQWLAGDLNKDGGISEADAELLGKYLSNDVRLSFPQWVCADMNGDSQTNEDDLVLLEERLKSGEEPESTVRLDVIEFSQFPDYPTGCESVALYMLLDYYDVSVSVEAIYDLLPRGAQPHLDKNGVRRGADPERQFVGDPRSSYSYGVFNVPIAEVANQFRAGARAESNVSLDRIRAILDTGAPVMAWFVIAPMRDIVYRWNWLDDQGGTVYWPGGEHAVVICGYDDDTVTYRDPNAGTTVTVDNELFLKRFNELGGRIVHYASDDELQQAVTAVAETTEVATTVTSASKETSAASETGTASTAEIISEEETNGESGGKNLFAAVIALIMAAAGVSAAVAAAVLRKTKKSKEEKE